MESKENLEQRLVSICQTVRKNALEPALKEIETLRMNIEREKEHILTQARRQAEETVRQAEETARDIRKAGELTLKQAMQQTTELLKEYIEKELFHPSIGNYISSQLSSESVTANLVEALVTALSKEGIFGDIECELGKKLSREAVAKELGKSVLDRLTSGAITIGNHQLGIILKVKDKNFVIDISDRAVKEFLASFMRNEFRKMLFPGEAYPT